MRAPRAIKPVSYTVRQAEQATGIKQSTLRTAIKRRELPAKVHSGSKYLIMASDLRAWMKRLPDAYPAARIHPVSWKDV